MFLSKFFTLQFWVNIPAALGLVLYFGNSDANSTTTNDNDTATSNTGFSEVEGEVVSASATGDSNVITTTATDHGTVDNAFDFANAVLNSNTVSNANALQVVSDSSSRYAQELSSFAEASSTNNDERMVTMVKWLLGAVVVLGGIKLAKGK